MWFGVQGCGVNRPSKGNVILVELHLSDTRLIAYITTVITIINLCMVAQSTFTSLFVAVSLPNTPEGVVLRYPEP